MATVVEQLAKGAHVAVIRLRSLGDCVLTTPAISLLKSHRPDLRLGVMVEPRFAAVFEGNPEIDDILEPKVRALRSFAPRLCLNLHGGTRSLLLTIASGARFKAGFAHYRYSWLYDVAMPRAQEILRVERKVHTAEHLASAMFHLGVPQAEVPKAKVAARPMRNPSPYAIIHALASAPEKTWPAERFVEIARYLSERCDLEPVFIGAAGEDMTPFRQFRIFAGPLDETKALIAGASLFVGNDSGPAHLAAALNIPAIVMFGASDHVVWAPWRANAESIVAPGGMHSVPVSQLIGALGRILKIRAGAPAEEGTRGAPNPPGSVVRAGHSNARTGPAGPPDEEGTRGASNPPGSVVRAGHSNARTGPAGPPDEEGTRGASNPPGSVVRAGHSKP